jgi:hypothetical protein
MQPTCTSAVIPLVFFAKDRQRPSRFYQIILRLLMSQVIHTSSGKLN